MSGLFDAKTAIRVLEHPCPTCSVGWGEWCRYVTVAKEGRLLPRLHERRHWAEQRERHQRSRSA